MSIRRSALITGIAAASLLAGVVSVHPATAAHKTAHKTWTVWEKPGKAKAGFVFSPAKLTIKVGDTVVWKDANSVPHNIMGTNAASKKVINRSAINTKTYQVTFKKKGDYKYQCIIHAGMVGEILVK